MTDVTVRFPRELAAVVQDALDDQAAAHAVDALNMRDGSAMQDRLMRKATLCAQATRLVTLARASQDEDSGIGPLTRSAA